MEAGVEAGVEARGREGGRRQGWGQGSLWGAGEGKSPRQVSEAAFQTWLFPSFFFFSPAETAALCKPARAPQIN